MREEEAYDAFKKAIDKDEKLKAISHYGIFEHHKPFDGLAEKFKDIFPTLVKSVTNKNNFDNVVENTRSTLHSIFSEFKNDYDVNRYMTAEDLKYIVKVYTENFFIQANNIWKENKFMREIFKFDDLFE